MAKSNRKIYIGISIITVAIIAVVVVYYFTVLKPAKLAGNDEEFEKKIEAESKKPASTPSSSSSTSSSSTSTSGSGVTNDTVLKLTSPLMKNDRVQWVQYLNNKYAKAKKAKDKNSNLAILTEDGIYGTKTEAAVNRLMGKKTTTWTEFQTRVNGYLASL